MYCFLNQSCEPFLELPAHPTSRQTWIMDSLLWISDSRYWIPDRLNHQDPEFYKQKFPRFQNPCSLTWNEWCFLAISRELLLMTSKANRWLMKVEQHARHGVTTKKLLRPGAPQLTVTVQNDSCKSITAELDAFSTLTHLLYVHSLPLISQSVMISRAVLQQRPVACGA